MSTSSIGSSDPLSSALSSLPGMTNLPSAAALSGVTNDPSSSDPTAASGASGSSTAGSSASTTSSGLTGITPDDFLKMLITELQNQDPMNPTNSDQIMQQISEIRNIQATSDLTTSLNSVVLGQSLATAGSLIGRQIEGLASDGTQVSGAVSSVSLKNGTPEVNVGGQTLELSNITSVDS
ncbi:MAG TPA: flagellar hook capping FlgD N-terminal domain-containing protein [Pirellulales bacterium]|nr:flagellar hook capping FlgD N-terminal domain-containing protein [Pirellulales bacterium]